MMLQLLGILNLCQGNTAIWILKMNEEKQRFMVYLKKFEAKSIKLYLLHLCFDSLSGTDFEC